jgi:hypothetical protein
VSIKRNPGQNTHEQCDAHGYVTIRPRASTPLPPIQPGESHILHAELVGDGLTLTADGKVVWQGSIGDGMTGINGPVGLRTDNARFEFDYYATPTAVAPPNRCDASGHDAGAD